MNAPNDKKDPKRWLFLAAALMPFVVATIYMTYKPVPQRIPRTHGGSAATEATTPPTTPPGTTAPTGSDAGTRD